MKIRDALLSDLPTIVDIYNASIPGRLSTGDTQPIAVESRLTWYKEHSPLSRPIWVAESEVGIMGWLSFQSFYYNRAAYQGTAELSIYIAPSYQRQGIGQHLLAEAIRRSHELEVKTLLGFIFGHNHGSLALFEKFGFERWGYLPKIAELDNIKRDLVIMGRHIVSEI